MYFKILAHLRWIKVLSGGGRLSIAADYHSQLTCTVISYEMQALLVKQLRCDGYQRIKPNVHGVKTTGPTRSVEVDTFSISAVHT